MSARAALVAIDLGAESCRVSLLQWPDGTPSVRMVHRFANAPIASGASLRWDLDRICSELEQGLRSCAEFAPDGIASIGVTGWAVDYVRLDANGRPHTQPFCYRDARTAGAMAAVHERVPVEHLYAVTGVQIQQINTIYQLYADKLSGVPDAAPWVNLPEYILHWLGGPRVAEYTNATHTALIDARTQRWSSELFGALGLDLAAAPEIVAPGTPLGAMNHRLSKLAAFRDTQLIAPACHDTASAIAGIPAEDDSWAYISSGTWSLVGTPLATPHNTAEARALGFTNLGGVAGRVLLHRGIPGMWILRQCMDVWERQSPCSVEALIAECEGLPEPDFMLDLDDPEFLAPGDMPVRIYDQLARRRLPVLPSGCEAAPLYANLIFHSLAGRYSALLKSAATMTGKKLNRICVVGGGSRNELLNRLTAQASGLPVTRCSPESSTVGNFAVQCSRLDQPEGNLSAATVAAHARALVPALQSR